MSYCRCTKLEFFFLEGGSEKREFLSCSQLVARTVRHTTVVCVMHHYLLGFLPDPNSGMENACHLLQNFQTKSGIQLAFHTLVMG